MRRQKGQKRVRIFRCPRQALAFRPFRVCLAMPKIRPTWRIAAMQQLVDAKPEHFPHELGHTVLVEAGGLDASH